MNKDIHFLLKILTTLSFVLEKDKAIRCKNGNFGIRDTSIFYPILEKNK